MVEIEKAVFPAIGVPVREQEWSRGESNPRPQPGREPENRSREERGRRPAPGLVDDPLDGDRGIDDGRPRPLSATHRVRGRIRTVLSVAWRFRVRRVAARLAAARRAKACRFFKTESDSRRRISSSTDRPCARARVRRALATRSSRLRTLNSAMLGRCHLTPPGVNGRAAATSAVIAEGLRPANPDLGQRLSTGADAWRYLPAGDVASPGCAHVAAQPPESPECSSARPELDSELYRE